MDVPIASIQTGLALAVILFLRNQSSLTVVYYYET
jgi:hypothetical protein